MVSDYLSKSRKPRNDSRRQKKTREYLFLSYAISAASSCRWWYSVSSVRVSNDMVAKTLLRLLLCPHCKQRFSSHRSRAPVPVLASTSFTLDGGRKAARSSRLFHPAWFLSSWNCVLEHHRTWPQRDRSSLAVVRNAWPSSCPRGQQLRLFSCWGCFPSKSDRLGDRTTDAPSVYHRGTSPEYPSPALQPKRILEQGSSSTVSQFPSSLEARAGLRAPRDGVSSPAGRRTCSQGGSWEDKQRTNEDRALRESGQGCRVSECPDVECGLGSPRDLISGRGVSPRACVLEATQGAAGSNESFITSQGNMTLDPTVNLENGAFDLDSHDVAGDCSVKSESVGRPSGNIRDRATTGIRAVGLPSGKNNEPAERPEFCTTEPDIASEAPRMKRSPGSFLAEPITSTEKPVLRKGKTVTGIDRQGSTRTAAAIETKGARRHSAPVKVSGDASGWREGLFRWLCARKNHPKRV